MWPSCLSAVLVVTAAFGYLCLVEGTEVDKDRRFINSALPNSTHAPGGGSHCGLYYCTHGSCQYTTINGVETHHSCTCHHGWHGEHCDQPVPTTTAKPDTMTGNNNHYDQACNYHGNWYHSRCHCHDNWSGDRCQYPPGSGQKDHCLNHCGEHGTCTRHQSHHGQDYWNCKCDRGWHGDYCTYQYIVTHSTHCHNTYCVNGDCTYNLDTNGYKWNYHCKCHHGWEGNHCDQEKITPTSSEASTTPMPTIPKQTTTNSPLTVTPSAVFYRCDHIKTIVAVAYQTPVSNPNAGVCSQGQHTSHEAFVLTECDVPKTPATWIQGVNVMSSCASSNPVPDNTPIASFDHGLYSSVGSLSGIFLGCTSNGFKIAYQTCSQSPEITELRVGESFNRNPNNYFAIS
ncbi:neurogenic locus notch homolog protein 1-like isoform X2 [Ruditapes philippinarum]|uniref:neurogenic locus notch homolog protein 1-like isoform X2 n=1 Tax=Ruditapes philippinarum TaxID=129788 RepID=UPI00295BEF42|nr:neurogenic locus notch homolog protein 1-like isoform X2 [Ruditapes philippinarum]